jgi:hypothetical protein
VEERLMNKREVSTELQLLAQCEMASSHIINQAAENLNNRKMRNRLFAMHQQCENNVDKISRSLLKYCKEAPTYTYKFSLEGYAAMRCFTSHVHVLSALETNTKLILTSFEESLALDWPKEIANVIKKIYEEKKRGLKKIDDLKSEV